MKIEASETCQAILKSNGKVIPHCTLCCLHPSELAWSSIVKQSKHHVFDRFIREKLGDTMTAMSSQPVDDPSSVFDEKHEPYEDEQQEEMNLPAADLTDCLASPLASNLDRSFDQC